MQFRRLIRPDGSGAVDSWEVTWVGGEVELCEWIGGIEDVEQRVFLTAELAEAFVRDEIALMREAGFVEEAPAQKEAADRRDHALVAHMRAHPDDDGARLVVGDWLIEQGDPYGRFLVSALGIGDRRLFDELRGRVHLAVFDAWAPTEVGATWRRGFLQHLRLRLAAPSDVDMAGRLPELLRHPASWLLQTLHLDTTEFSVSWGSSGSGHDGLVVPGQPLQRSVDALIATRPPPLESLGLVGTGASLSLEGLVEHLPTLRHLRVTCHAPLGAAIDEVVSFGRSLEHLDLSPIPYLADRDDEAEAEAHDQLAQMIAAGAFPHLRVLNLVGAEPPHGSWLHEVMTERSIQPLPRIAAPAPPEGYAQWGDGEPIEIATRDEHGRLEPMQPEDGGNEQDEWEPWENRLWEIEQDDVRGGLSPDDWFDGEAD